MTNVHAKSTCCSAKIRLFGKRRRQCCHCKRTWTVRCKKRGPKVKRIRSDLLQRVIQQSQSIKGLSKHLSITEQALSYRFRQLLRDFVKQPSPQEFPVGSLILIVDGLWFRYQGRFWTLYLGAVRSTRSHHAIFLDPLLLSGRENLPDWTQFIQSIPPPIKHRIKALVADNFRGAKNLAQRNGWILQLCHFHLICHLQSRRGHWRSITKPHIREEIYQLIRKSLELPEGQEINNLLERLTILQEEAPTERLRMIAREFIRNQIYYRAYYAHPHLNLPSTTNTIEAMGKKIRNLMSRLGNLRTPQSLALWAVAYVRLHPIIRCKGKNQQNLFV